MAPSLWVAPGRPFVHLVIPSRRPRWELVEQTPQSLTFDVRLMTGFELASTDPAAKSTIVAVLDKLERANATGQQDVQELISVSFLEK